MQLVYIHGNGATADSFNFIREQVNGHAELVLEYDSTRGFYRNLEEMLPALEGLDDMFFVAHSLGGIYALHLAHALPDKVAGGVTLSTPYGGSEAAKYVKYMLPFHQVLHDIQPHGAPIMEAHGFALECPWTNVVSTEGKSPFMVEPNDGVVTEDSMRHRSDIRLVDVASNHYEVLLSQETVAIIQETLQEAQRELARRIIVCA